MCIRDSPTIICAQNFSLEDQLKQAIKGKKAEIGIAVIIDGKDTVTVNNDIHYPLMSVFKFHQALALADYMGKQQQSLNFEMCIRDRHIYPMSRLLQFRPELLRPASLPLLFLYFP